jgi:hypothetical protein
MRRRWFVGAAVVLGTAVVLPRPSSASGDLPGFTARAVAEGGRLTFSVPGFAVVEDIIDGGGPVSQAVVDSQGASSFASLPYPGETALAFPGLFSAVSGQTLPAGYPFFVSASHPTTPQQELKDPAGAYQLTASAASGTAGGLAQFRGQGGEGQNGGSGGTRATTSVHGEGDTINVVAETVNEALNLGGGALRIASVRSRSVSTYKAGDPNPATKTELTVDGAAAGDTRFGFGPDGLVVAGQGVPIPAGSGLKTLNEALAPAGLQVRFAEPRTLVGGASAGALEVAMTQKSPTPGVPGGTIRIRFGGATSTVTLGTAVPAGTGVGSGASGAGDVTPPAASQAPVPPARPAGDAAGLTAPSGALSGGPSGATPAALSDTARFDTPSSPLGGGALGSGSVASGSSSGAVSAPSTDVPLTAASQPILSPRRIGADGFVFGSLIVAGLLMMILSSLWRAKGVLR